MAPGHTIDLKMKTDFPIGSSASVRIQTKGSQELPPQNILSAGFRYLGGIAGRPLGGCHLAKPR
jgi:hypothetical protein